MRVFPDAQRAAEYDEGENRPVKAGADFDSRALQAFVNEERGQQRERGEDDRIHGVVGRVVVGARERVDEILGNPIHSISSYC